MGAADEARASNTRNGLAFVAFSGAMYLVIVSARCALGSVLTAFVLGR